MFIITDDTAQNVRVINTEHISRIFPSLVIPKNNQFELQIFAYMSDGAQLQLEVITSEQKIPDIEIRRKLSIWMDYCNNK